MTRKMYDGIDTDAKTIRQLWQPGDLVAYYIDGLYRWTNEEISWFPVASRVTITVLGNPADVADCETGDLSPESAAAWVRRQKAAGYWRPTIYRSFAFMQDIRNTTGELILGKDWDAWVAHYDGSPTPDYPFEAAKQYSARTLYDLSVVYDDQWPHRHLPVPPKPTNYPKWPAGVILQFGNVGNAVQALQQALHNSGLFGVRGIDVDGIFGQQTQTAVHNFEDAAGIPQDVGIAGPQVRNALISRGLLQQNGQAA